MKTIATYIGIVSILISSITCIDPSTRQKKQTKKPFISNIDSFIISFNRENPDIFKNDLTQKEANKIFKQQFEKYVKDSSGLKLTPLSIVSVNKAPGDGYIVHFEGSEYSGRPESLSYKVHIDIFGITSDKKMAMGLDQASGRYVLVDYKKAMFIHASALSSITNDRVWNDKISIDKDFSDANYSLGNYILEIDSLKKIN